MRLAPETGARGSPKGSPYPRKRKRTAKKGECEGERNRLSSLFHARCVTALRAGPSARRPAGAGLRPASGMRRALGPVSLWPTQSRGIGFLGEIPTPPHPPPRHRKPRSFFLSPWGEHRAPRALVRASHRDHDLQQSPELPLKRGLRAGLRGSSTILTVALTSRGGAKRHRLFVLTAQPAPRCRSPSRSPRGACGGHRRPRQGIGQADAGRRTTSFSAGGGPQSARGSPEPDQRSPKGSHLFDAARA